MCVSLVLDSNTAWSCGGRTGIIQLFLPFSPPDVSAKLDQLTIGILPIYILGALMSKKKGGNALWFCTKRMIACGGSWTHPQGIYLPGWSRQTRPPSHILFFLESVLYLQVIHSSSFAKNKSLTCCFHILTCARELCTDGGVHMSMYPTRAGPLVVSWFRCDIFFSILPVRR